MPLLFEPGVIGVDEAGRGPLAGPVVVAAVILPADFDLAQINDSKKLDSGLRQELEERIRASATYAIEFGDLEAISRRNILHATLDAMRRAVQALGVSSLCIIDGNQIPPEMPVPCQALVDGDALHASIAAASILAKNVRDRYMVEQAGRFPEYGFDRHFGYATPEHLAAIREFGPCELHRRTFEPIRSILEQPCLDLGG